MKNYSTKYFMSIRDKEINLNTADNDLRKNNNSLIKYSSILLSLIGLLVPAIYFLGFKFHEGVLSAYGIDAKYFPLDTVDVYISSYTAMAYYIFDYLKSINKVMYVVVMSMVVLVIFIGIIKFISTKNISSRLNISKLNNNIKYELIDKVFSFIFGVIILVSLTVIIGILWIMLPQNFYTKGQFSVIPQIREYHVFGCNYGKDDWSICTQVLDENKIKIFEGLLVENNSKYVAFYDINGSHIFKLKSNEILYRKKILYNNKTKY